MVGNQILKQKIYSVSTILYYSFPPFPCLILKLPLVARWLFGLTRVYRRYFILQKLGNGTFVWLVLYSLERHRDEKGTEYSWTLLLWSENWCLRFQKYKYRHARGTSFPGMNENLLCLEWAPLNFTLPWESLTNFCLTLVKGYTRLSSFILVWGLEYLHFFSILNLHVK